MTRSDAAQPPRALRLVPNASAAPIALTTIPVTGGRVTVRTAHPETPDQSHEELVVLDLAGDELLIRIAETLPTSRALAPDLAGLGWPARSFDAYALAASRLAEVLDAQQVERAIVVGRGPAADLAIAFADLHPSRISALVLANGGLHDRGEVEQEGHAPHEVLARLRIPIAVVFGGPGGEESGYSAAFVASTAGWLRHVEVIDLDASTAGDTPAGDGHVQAIAVLVREQLASVRSRAAHPATGSHRIIDPAPPDAEG